MKGKNKKITTEREKWHLFSLFLSLNKIKFYKKERVMSFRSISIAIYPIHTIGLIPRLSITKNIYKLIYVKDERKRNYLITSFYFDMLVNKISIFMCLNVKYFLFVILFLFCFSLFANESNSSKSI